MNPVDESELRRLSELLRQIDVVLPRNAPEREALVKAGIALVQTFISGGRLAVEKLFAEADATLSNEQIAYLRSIGLEA